MILPSNFNGYFVYGSTLYGVSDDQSDVDIVMFGGFSDQLDHNSMEIHQVDCDEFRKSVENCHPVGMEGYSLQFHGDKYENLFKFSHLVKMDIDLDRLRRSHAAISSNSFVKAKKKLTIPESYNRRSSMKSLFHSIRILDFGCQVAEHGFIRDFQSCKDLYNEIVSDYENPDEVVLELIATKYKLRYNEYATRFRELAPKNVPI